MKEEIKLTILDKIKLNILGIIPDKEYVRKYLDKLADDQAKARLILMHLERVK